MYHTERELLITSHQQMFTIEKLMGDGTLSLHDFDAFFPGFFHFNYIHDLSIKEMGKKGLEFLHVEQEEVIQNFELLTQLVHPDCTTRVYGNIWRFAQTQETDKSIHLFQRIKSLKKDSDYSWVMSCVKHCIHDNTLFVMSIPLRNIEQTQKVIQAQIPDRAVRQSQFLRFQSLTPREKEVFSWIVKGLKRDEIVDKMCISKHTYDTHRKNIRNKLEVKSFRDWIQYAQEFGILEAG